MSGYADNCTAAESANLARRSRALDAFVAKITPPTGATGPQLVYSTYLGGAGVDQGFAIAVDSANNAYITGTTSSADLSTSIPSTQRHFKRHWEVERTLSSPKSAGRKTRRFFFPLNYLSFLGGSDDDLGFAIVDDIQGVRVTGSTASANFPEANAIQNATCGRYRCVCCKADTTAATATSRASWQRSWAARQ